MKKAANPDDLLNTEIKIVDEVTLSFVAPVHRFQRYISGFEVWNCTMRFPCQLSPFLQGESGIEMTAEERRKKKEEEKKKVEEEKKVEGGNKASRVEEERKKEEEEKKAEVDTSLNGKKRYEETDKVETKATEVQENENVEVDEAVEALPLSPLQQITLPYMKKKESPEIENTGEAFSYFSTSSTTLVKSSTTFKGSREGVASNSIIKSATIVNNGGEDTVEEPVVLSFEPEEKQSMAVVGNGDKVDNIDPVDEVDKVNKVEKVDKDDKDDKVDKVVDNEPSAASVVLEAQAIVAAVIGEASFISSFDSSRSDHDHGGGDI